ncbi:GAF domain-containing protein [Conexibacter woesei]|uniref:Signal transduction histidine kinase regulating citrate/malate metabolism n=1 Tax=Conexibacter woesei (strain DSM 14684 / CCUG 47730 / CIP 108061 / JCM 11494 / NBRC 100937 / ID131577) TaxID=469383 RepID=D3F6G2_CONWI|nr:GAF domain-containing protein [Conexibacter woesei]ADB50729.1 signal transduction histidine kinase regulating citrate/malate metabolism [Conexibacter woesei DSM 14684]
MDPAADGAEGRDGAVPPDDARMRALITVSRTITEMRSLGSALNRICEEAAGVAAAQSASVLLTTSKSPDDTGFYFRTGGRFGLSRAYRTVIDRPTGEAFTHKGASTHALETGRPILVEDTETDRIYRPWRELARSEDYRSAAVLPLRRGETPVGTLELYRRQPGTWAPETLQFLVLFAEQALVAIQTAKLIVRQQRQLKALERLVGGLRAQSHEHANTLHTIAGLLALDEYDALAEYVTRLGADSKSNTALAGRIRVPALAGLILTRCHVQGQQADVVLSPDSGLAALPARLDETDAVTIVGNLVQNAAEAVADKPPGERTVELTVREEPDPHRLVISVRDWGSGIRPADLDRVVQRGWSSKRGHHGIGLALVAEAVAEAGGTLVFEPRVPGLTVRVEIPYA